MPQPANIKQRLESLARLTANNSGSRLTRANDGNWWGVVSQNGRLWVRDVETREALLRDVSEILQGLWAFHIDPMPGEDSKEAREKPGQIRMQHARKWINTLAVTYKSEVARTFRCKGVDLKDTDPEVIAIKRAYDKMRVNEAMQRIDRGMLAYGVMTARVRYDEDRDEPVLGVFPAYRVRPVENAANPRHPWGLLLTGQEIERDMAGRGSYVEVADAWIEPTKTTVGEFASVRAGAFGKWMPISTQRPPLVHFADDLQTNETGFFVDPLGVALARLNVVLNEDLWTAFANTVLMQGFGQWIGYNLGPKTAFELGPNRMMSIDSSPDNPARIENVAPNAPLSDIQAAIDRVMQEIRFVHDIPESEFNVVTDAASGQAIIQAKMPTMERREERLKLFREPEDELFRVTLDVLSTFAGLKLRGELNDYECHVKYEKAQAAYNVTDQIALEKHDLELGLTTPALLLMKREPDAYKTIEEAQAELDKRAPDESPEPDATEQDDQAVVVAETEEPEAETK